jgi:hypothetical protein
MNYWVKHEGQQFGPYSLADVQRFVADGSILTSDPARSEGLEEWVPVSQVLGNITVQQPAPPPVNYGQVPVYASADAGATAALGADPLLPPNLHWAIVLLLGVLTCGLFSTVWMFVEAAFVNKLQTGSKAILFYAIGVAAMFASGIIGRAADEKAVGGVIYLVGIVLLIAGHFSMKSALEDHYTRVERIGLQLSGVMTFFFNVLYFQYHFSEIRRWKETGVLA